MVGQESIFPFSISIFYFPNYFLFIFFHAFQFLLSLSVNAWILTGDKDPSENRPLIASSHPCFVVPSEPLIFPSASLGCDELSLFLFAPTITHGPPE